MLHKEHRTIVEELLEEMAMVVKKHNMANYADKGVFVDMAATVSFKIMGDGKVSVCLGSMSHGGSWPEEFHKHVEGPLKACFQDYCKKTIPGDPDPDTPSTPVG